MTVCGEKGHSERALYAEGPVPGADSLQKRGPWALRRPEDLTLQPDGKALPDEPAGSPRRLSTAHISTDLFLEFRPAEREHHLELILIIDVQPQIVTAVCSRPPLSPEAIVMHARARGQDKFHQFSKIVPIWPAR